MEWLQHLISTVRPECGGVLTVSRDDDGLFDIPVVEPALAQAGVRLMRWDASDAMLRGLQQVPEHDRPLLVPGKSVRSHVIPTLLPTAVARPVHVGAIAPRLDAWMVKQVPWQRWDDVRRLSQRQSTTLKPRDTALLLARALYGLDSEFLRAGGWWRQALHVWAAGIAVPPGVAREVLTEVGAALPLTLADAVAALGNPAEAGLRLAEHARRDPTWLASLGPGERALVESLAAPPPVVTVTADQAVDWLAQWPGHEATAEQVLAFGAGYVPAAELGRVAPAVRAEVTASVEAWVTGHYNHVIQFENPAVPKLHRLVTEIDDGMDRKGRLLLVVLDAVGLAAWSVVAPIWQEVGVFARQSLRVALASLPTLTSVSRLALFDGKLRLEPSQWSATSKTAAEKQAWRDRFAERDGRCTVYRAGEPGLLDAVYQGVPRLALVDTTWDEQIHHLDPRFRSLADAAANWARVAADALGPVVREALASGYRVVVTADHGHIHATGGDRVVDKGRLAETWSKRVLLFASEATAQQFNGGKKPFRPATAPPGVWPVFAHGLESFDTNGVHGHSHGGLSLEELLVPVAELHR